MPSVTSILLNNTAFCSSPPPAMTLGTNNSYTITGTDLPTSQDGLTFTPSAFGDYTVTISPPTPIATTTAQWTGSFNVGISSGLDRSPMVTGKLSVTIPGTPPIVFPASGSCTITVPKP